MTPVHTLELLLALMSAAVLLAVAARALHVPPAAAYVLGGLLLAITPGVPAFEMEPGLILTLFLPPLLQSSAWFTNWQLFRTNLQHILALAVGCVGFTTVVVAVVAHAMMPGWPWAACFVLGAIVSPPDAVAASAILARLHLPRRLVAVLEGESLLNDASGLVLYRVGVAAALGQVASPLLAGGTFVWVAAGGMAVGLACGFGCLAILRRLHDSNLEIAASFLVAYAAYIGAEHLGLSGVLSVVTAGLFIGQRQHSVISAETRMQARATWAFVTFILEALVFVLIGLSLRGVVARMGLGQIAAALPLAAAIVAAITLARFVWVVPVAYVPRLLARRPASAPPWQIVGVLCWSGMRGMVSLATALALPASFPGRDLILFATFVTIVATVLVQGTTLGPLIQWLNVARFAESPAEMEAEIRAELADAARAVLMERANDPLDGAIAQDVLKQEELLDRQRGAGSLSAAERAELRGRIAIKLEAAEARRRTLLALHRTRHFSDDILFGLEHEIDLEEIRLRRRL